MTQKIMNVSQSWNKLFFITDLDRTLLYSKEPAHICVEMRNQKPAGFMTKEAANTLKAIMESDRTFFIPCTSRNIDQVKRIHFLYEADILSEYVFTENATKLYINGVVSNDYLSYVHETISHISEYHSECIEKAIEKIQDLFKNESYLLRVSSGHLFYHKVYMAVFSFQNEDISQKIFQSIKKIDVSGLSMVRDRRKIYLFPKGLNKSLSVQYLLEKHIISPKDLIIAAGDS